MSDYTAGLEQRNAVIAEKSAEIDRLRGNRNSLERLVAEHELTISQLEDHCDTLRLEVQKLKDLNFEAQDRYAALEAERDELVRRGGLDTVEVAVFKAEQDALRRALDAAMRTIGAQNAQVRAMNEQLDAVTQLIVHQVKEPSHD